MTSRTLGAAIRAILLLLTALPGCAKTSAPDGDGKSVAVSTQKSAAERDAAGNQAGSGTLSVIATYSILGDWVGRVGGEHIHLTTLVGPGGDAHTYEPTPQDSAAVADAKVLFENGLV
jgi:zinc/manganese transport system substrate-binding protein